MSLTARLLRPILEIRDEEAPTVFLMFAYSFLAMSSYTMLKPATRSTFIQSLGADNIPYLLLVAGFVIAFIMQGYTTAVSLLPRRWVIPSVQVVLIGLMLLFYALFQTGAEWVSVAFYLFGLLLGILLISQFWTLANNIFDPRQAKRVFGFIGAGASLGGILGSLISAQAERIGTYTLLLISAAMMAFCVFIVILVLNRNRHATLTEIAAAGEEKGVGAGEAIRLLRSSRHLQIIALVIGFAAIGAGLIEQQLNMAAEAFRGREADGLTAFLGQVQLYTSVAGFIIQIWLVSKIQRYLGVGFALLMLPVSLGTTAAIMLVNAALWAPSLARVLDTSLRYTVDKTTREILFLPLPADLKFRAKPFVDVTVDRMGKAVSALLSLVLIADWGLGWDWQRISWASLGITALWIFTSLRAKKGYLHAFRQSIERRDIQAADMRLDQGDLQTIETLVEELAEPDERRVLYAIDLLEALEKRRLITPLLLHHASSRVRTRALAALSARPDAADRWLPHVERMLADADSEVRAAALGALANMQHASVRALARPFLDDKDPRTVVTAATVLGRSSEEDDVRLAYDTLARLIADTSEASSPIRRDVAAALGQIRSDRFNDLLIPLMYDADESVAREAVGCVKAAGEANFLFVPTLVSLLRQRQLKGPAREVLVGYGEPVVEALAHFLNDENEEPWVRRHIPATLARIPCQRSMDAMIGALGTVTDGFLRYKLLSSIERLHRAQPALAFDKALIERQALRETKTYYAFLSLGHNLTRRAGLSQDDLLVRILREKRERAVDRLFTLLAVNFPARDVDATRYAIERGDARARSSALEYLDNLLTGTLRKRVMPIFDDASEEDQVRKANVFARTRTRDIEETLLELMNDDDEVVAAAAIYTAGRRNLWGLAGDIEHVLAHRDARDWYVFEAASWALAERRLSEDRRRALWREPLPSVEVVARLARLPVFRATSVDELFRIANVGRQHRYEPGQPIVAPSAQATELVVLVDGRADGAGGPVEGPRFLVFEEAFDGRAVERGWKATSSAITFQLPIDQWRNLMADSSRLVQGIFTTILENSQFTNLCGRLPAAAGQLDRIVEEGVTPIEKVFVLQQVPAFSGVSADEALAIADRVRRLTFSEGERLAGLADAAALVIIAAGSLVLEGHDGTTMEADSGDIVGMVETLAAAPLGRAVKARSAGVALTLSGDDLFDVLEEHPTILNTILQTLLRARTQQVAGSV